MTCIIPPYLLELHGLLLLRLHSRLDRHIDREGEGGVREKIGNQDLQGRFFFNGSGLGWLSL